MPLHTLKYIYTHTYLYILPHIYTYINTEVLNLSMVVLVIAPIDQLFCRTHIRTHFCCNYFSHLQLHLLYVCMHMSMCVLFVFLSSVLASNKFNLLNCQFVILLFVVAAIVRHAVSHLFCGCFCCWLLPFCIYLRVDYIFVSAKCGHYCNRI